MKVYFYCILLFVTNIVFSQSKTTFTTKEYLEIQDKTRSYFNSDVDSAFFYANKIEKSSNIIHKAFASSVKGYLYAKKGDFVKARNHYKVALQFINASPKSYLKTQNEAYIYNYGGMIDWYSGEFSKALDQYFMAKKIAISIDDVIQVVKTNNNIALIDGNAGNYKKAIAAIKESDRIVDENKHLYLDNQYAVNKCSMNLNIGKYYESYYSKNPTQTQALDSAFYYFNVSLLHSENSIESKLKAQKNIGNIYFLKNDLKAAEKIYYTVLVATKENNFEAEYYSANFNLGYIYYKQKQYNKSLIFFQKVKLMEVFNKDNFFDYMYSNYFQAKLFKLLNNDEKAVEHSKIYLDFFEKNKSRMDKDALEINLKMGNQDLEAEMNDLQNEYEDKILLKNAMAVFFVTLLVVLLILFMVNYKRRKLAEQKITAILDEYKSSNDSLKNTALINPEIQFSPNDNKIIKEVSSININNEEEIMMKLKKLEDQMFYLKPEFSQQQVAKRIKTNTTYLSYVVNKNYQKSFSVYYNELRINYVINEIIANAKYRAYTTQAIAESAGFKNADSFASSFKKKTGVTPYQFINEMKKRESI